MKTRVRIQAIYSPSPGYEKIDIQLLRERFPKSKYLTSIGHLSMQRNKGEERWYGLTYHTSADNHKDVLELAKIAKMLGEYESRTHIKIEELLGYLNAEQYFHSYGDFINVDDIGKGYYTVYDSKGEHYNHLIATDKEDAKRKFGRLYKDGGYTMKWSHVIKHPEGLTIYQPTREYAIND